MSWKYLKYLFVSTKKISFILLIVNLLVYNFSPLLYSIGKNRSNSLYIITILILVESALIAINYNKIFQSKNSCDAIYSLPIKRVNEGLIIMLFGFIQIVMCMIAPILLKVITLLFNNADYIGNVLCYFLVISFVTLCWYIMIWFICTFSHSLTDSIILNIIWILFFLIIPIPFNISTGVLTSYIKIANYVTCYYQMYQGYTLSKIIIPIVIGVIASIGFMGVIIHNFKTNKAENVNMPNNRWLGYRIPCAVLFTYLFSYLFYADYTERFVLEIITLSILIIVFLGFCYIGIMSIANRKLRITKYMILSYGIIILSGFAIGIVIALLNK